MVAGVVKTGIKAQSEFEFLRSLRIPFEVKLLESRSQVGKRLPGSGDQRRAEGKCQ